MVNRLCVGLFLLCAGAALGFGQASVPRQGGLPVQNGQSLTGMVTGTLRRISNLDLVIEAHDKRIVTIALGVTVGYYRAALAGGGGSSQSSAKLTDFQPGDQVSVEYFQVTPSYFRATKIALIKAGTPDDRSRALQPVDASPAAAAASSTVSNTDSPDRRATLQRQQPGQAASADHSVPAEEGNGVARLPDGRLPAPPPIEPSQSIRASASRAGVDPIIESARQAAFSFSQTLPNYIVQQRTNRYGTESAHGSRTSWQAIDTVTADVICEDGKESYKNILVDGKPPRGSVEDSGAWSTGEYISVQLDLLAENTNADFHNRRSDTIVNRAAYLYDFTVQQPNSHWELHAFGQEYRPGYSGAIWIDKENSRVLRIELSAKNMASSFPLDTVESAVDYDYVLIGDGKFLLPAHSESISCKRGSGICDRNVIDFRNYRKFTADTNIKFGPDQ